MSYISACDNPEGLKIWCDGKKIVINQDCHLTREMPRSIFHGLMLKWLENRGDGVKIKYKGAEIVEGKMHHLGRISILYKDFSVYMYVTTAFYIAMSVKDRESTT